MKAIQPHLLILNPPLNLLVVASIIIRPKKQLQLAVVVRLDLQILITNSMIATFLLSNQMGVWFLDANLVIAKGATFHIDSTDTKWLKISSMVTRGAGSAKLSLSYIIDVHGSLKIDSEDNIMGSNNKLLCYN
ncbi:MAG: hypothetical protein WCF23_13315 [Candidatus Nitrosopolaris sp.]